MGFKIRKVIVRVPTKEDWRDVVKQAIKDGCRKTGAILSGSWETYGDDSCICIEEDGELNYGKWSNSKTYDGFDTYLITQEYLNKFKQTSDEKPNKQRKRIMSIIKDIFKTKEQKTLAYYNLTNGDGGLTEDGQKEFIDYIWETDEAKRKEFVAKIVEQFEEDHKRK